MSGQKCHLIVSWWSLNSQGVSFRRDGSLLDAAGVSRIIGGLRGRCKICDRHISIYITLLNIYSLGSATVSWMIDEANAFCLRSGGINTILQGFHCAKWRSCMRKTTKEQWWAKGRNSKQVFFFTWHWIMGQNVTFACCTGTGASAYRQKYQCLPLFWIRFSRGSSGTVVSFLIFLFDQYTINASWFFI